MTPFGVHLHISYICVQHYLRIQDSEYHRRSNHEQERSGKNARALEVRRTRVISSTAAQTIQCSAQKQSGFAVRIGTYETDQLVFVDESAADS